jgi:hypothetical protein
MNADRLAGLLLLAILATVATARVTDPVASGVPEAATGDITPENDAGDPVNQPQLTATYGDKQKQNVQTKYPLKRFQAKYTTCEPLAVEGFGISGPKMFNSHPASIKELGICRKNYESCCDFDGMVKAVEQVSGRLRKCNQYFSFLERLLSLFRGETYKYALGNAKARPECHVSALSSLDAEKAKTFFDNASIQENIKKIKVLLEDYPNYMSNWNTLYGNILCAICNPSEARFFIFGKCKKNGCLEGEEMLKYHLKTRSELTGSDRSKVGSKLKTSIFLDDSTALFVLMQREFEYRMIQTMMEFMIPFANLIRCVSNNEDDPDFVVDPIKKSKIVKETFMIERCLNTNNINPCREFVEFNFVRMEFKRIIFTQAQQLFRIFYITFIEGELPDSFEESPNASYLAYKTDNYCRIFPGNPVSRFYQIRKAAIYVLEDGCKVSLSKIHKNLVEIDRMSSAFLSALVYLAIAFGLFLV